MLGFYFCNFLKILMVSGKTIYKAFRIHETKDFIYFHNLPKTYIGFKLEVKRRRKLQVYAYELCSEHCLVILFTLSGH